MLPLLGGARGGFTAILVLLVAAVPADARSKKRSAASQELVVLDAALEANDLEAAQRAADSAYQQATNTPSLQSSDSSVIIDPVMVDETVEFNRTKTAFEIARSYYDHAELDAAKQWAMTCTNGSTLTEEYVRKAAVLLGRIATAMDKDDEAVANFLTVIRLPNLYREQPSAYAGLYEVLMLQKRDDLVEAWVRDGQSKFEGAGELQLAFLREAAKTLKRRNHPLWHAVDQQIVDVTSVGAPGQRRALLELASDARKHGRWAQAETNYAALCRLDFKSAEECVNAYLFLARARAKQGKDYTGTLQQLQQKSTDFTDATDREYATYRLGKFYEEQGRLDSAITNYQSLVSSLSTSTWAAASLHQLAALKERQGDLKTALQLYLQYPRRFPGNERLAVQAYAGALNVADALGQTNVAEQIVGVITNRAAKIQDYNVHLNLAFYFKKRGRDQIAESWLQSAVPLARRAVAATADPPARSLIHFRVLRRFFDFAQYQRMVEYFNANSNDLADDSLSDDYQLQCRCYKTMALASLGQRQAAMDEIRALMDRAQGNSELEAKFAEILALYSDRATAAELFDWVANKYPAHPWANIGRLEQAIQKFNASDYAAAQKLTEDITNALKDNEKMVWIHRMYWEAVYLRGCCLQAAGQVEEGDRLKQTAIAKSADLRVQKRVTAK